MECLPQLPACRCHQMPPPASSWNALSSATRILQSTHILEMLGTLILNELKSLSALQSDRDQDVAFFATKEPKQQDVLGATVLKKQS